MSKRWLIGGAVFLAALLIASIIVALLESEDPLPEGTPEAAVQAYLAAAEDGNLDEAYGYLAKRLREGCAVETFAGRRYPAEEQLQGARVTLERTATAGDTVFVTVRVTNYRGGSPFTGSERSFDQRFALALEDGDWRFTEYPWPFFECGYLKAVPPTPVPTATPPPAATTTPRSG